MSAPELQLPDGWISPDVDLVGVDGNAFAILAFTTRALRDAGNASEVVDAYKETATAGDYDHLLAVSMAYCGMLS